MFRLGETDGEAGQPEGQHPDAGHGEHGDEHRAPGDSASETSPEAVLGYSGCLVHTRHEGPEESPAAHDERCRQHDKGEEYRHDYSDRAGEAESSVAGQLREEQGDEAERDCSAARGDRWSRALHCGEHREGAVLDLLQFLSIARNEQQRIVRARPEDQHREDAADRGIQSDSEWFGEGRDHCTGETIRRADDREWHNPEHRAAVGDDQENGDDNHRDEQELEVGAGEGVADVGLESDAAGEITMESRWQVLRRGRAKRFGGACDVFIDGPRAKGHHREGGCAVVAELRRRGARRGRQRAEGSSPFGDGCAVGGGELRVAPTPDEDRRCLLGRGELGERSIHLCGLARGGQSSAWEVVAGALRQEGEQQPDRHDGADEHDPRRSPTADESPNRRHNSSN